MAGTPAGEAISERRKAGWTLARICEAAWARHGGWDRAGPIIAAGFDPGAPDELDLETRQARARQRIADMWRRTPEEHQAAGAAQAARSTAVRRAVDRRGRRAADDVRDLTRTIVEVLGVRDPHAIAAARVLLTEPPKVLDARWSRTARTSDWADGYAAYRRSLQGAIIALGRLPLEV